MKYLKFDEPLVEKVLSGEKKISWRIDDEKEIDVNDTLSLQDKNGEEFATAKVLWVKKTTFGRLTEEDSKRHESFETEEEMLETYSGYYDTDVDMDTEVKVIRFELLEKVK